MSTSGTAVGRPAEQVRAALASRRRAAILLARLAAGRHVTHSDDAFPVLVRSRTLFQHLKEIGVMLELIIDITAGQSVMALPIARQPTPWSTSMGNPGKR